MKSSGIGGQAVLEGVMMRNRSLYSVAVRKPDGEIEVTRGKCKSASDRALFFRLPIIRGIVSFIDSLVIGMRTLNYSATFYEEEEEKEREKKKEESEEKNDWRENAVMGVTFFISIVIAVAIFFFLPYGLSMLLSDRVKSYALLAVIEGVFRAALFIGYILVITLMKDIRRTFMYHGAEHKTINCVENGLDLTVGNVRGQSRYHKRCGTNFMVLVIFLSIILFMFIHFENVWLRLLARIILVPIIAGIAYEFIRLAGNSDSKVMAVLSKPGMLFQRLTTREPDNRMIEVAIASVEEVFDWREYQRISIAAQRTQARLDKNKQEANKKSRAQIAQEIKEREAENSKRANDRNRRLAEQEKKSQELQRIADEAGKRKDKRAEQRQGTQEDDSEILSALDHYFDGGDEKENAE